MSPNNRATDLTFSDVVLFYGEGVDKSAAEMLEKVNAFFPATYGRAIRHDDFASDFGFVSCDDPSLPNHWYSAKWFLESSIAIGAVPCLLLQPFMSHLRSLRWKYPRQITLIEREHGYWLKETGVPDIIPLYSTVLDKGLREFIRFDHDPDNPVHVFEGHIDMDASGRPMLNAHGMRLPNNETEYFDEYLAPLFGRSVKITVELLPEDY